MRGLWFWIFLALPSGLSAQSATLAISSSQAGQSVAPGSSVDWTIAVTVSSGDNEGLALVVVDLFQDVTNPERFDLTPGSVPISMANFSRPQGISNPGPGGVGTGYGGSPTGVVGERDLLQIGGAQNTFGVPGSGIGTGVAVVTSIGQGTSVVVAQGSFTAPDAVGSYSVHLVGGIVNVLTVVGIAPGHSTAVKADLTTAPGTLSFDVAGAPEFDRGDCNVDGSTNIADTIHLLSHLFSGPVTLACDDACDTNDDGAVDLGDAINLLTTLFDSGPPLPAPNGACGADPTADLLECNDFSECN